VKAVVSAKGLKRVPLGVAGVGHGDEHDQIAEESHGLEGRGCRSEKRQEEGKAE